MRELRGVCVFSDFFCDISLIKARKLLLVSMKLVSMGVSWWVSICVRDPRSSSQSLSSIKIILLLSCNRSFIDILASTRLCCALPCLNLSWPIFLGA